jgi:hypothetical protein
MRPTRLIVCPTAANSFTLTRAREDGLWQGSRRLRVSSEPVSGIRNQAIGRIYLNYFLLYTRARAETKTRRRFWRSAAAVSEMEFNNLQVM